MPNRQNCFTIGRNRGPIKVITRNLFLLLAILALLGCQPGTATPRAATATSGPHTSIAGQRQYTVHQQVELVNEGTGAPEKQNIWIALIGDFPPYQQVKSMKISPTSYTLLQDEYGNQYAEFDFSGQKPGTTQAVEIDYQVVVNEVAYDLSACQGELPEEFIQPELHIESRNPQIVSLANDLSRGAGTPCQQVRLFYDYVDEHLTYTPNGENWGAQAALGPMGSDCTEYADLLVAMSRSQGIPARYFEGLLYTDQAGDAPAKLEHAWPDVYLPGIGWTAMDPTLGRLPANHDAYFAHYIPDHIIVTMGADPSVLRGSSYWTHLYWPGNSTTIRVVGSWQVELANPDVH